MCVCVSANVRSTVLQKIALRNVSFRSSGGVDEVGRVGLGRLSTDRVPIHIYWEYSVPSDVQYFNKFWTNAL